MKKFKRLEVPEDVRHDWEKKTCARCGEKKTRGDFYKDKRTLDKLRHECKTCFEFAREETLRRKYARYNNG